jgi:membrane associated rhomboid family serine protease
MITITVVILAITCIISFTAFSNEKVMEDLIFYPPAITNRNQWYRFITSGLIHADIMHLAFNMYSFYLFGRMVEEAFIQIFGERGKAIYVLLYVIALVVCLLKTYLFFNLLTNYRMIYIKFNIR